MFKIFGFLAILGLGFYSLMALSSHNNDLAAAANMLWSLFLMWVLLGGTTMYKYRDKIKSLVLRIKGSRASTFILFSSILLLIEEAVATAITNLAPLFGSASDLAHITASGNYWEVILHHSAIVLIPVFIVWGYLLSKYEVKPDFMFLICGITGVTSEFSLGGSMTGILFGYWMLVYGFMAYLPTYVLPTQVNLKKFDFKALVLFLVLPWTVAIPIALIMSAGK